MEEMDTIWTRQIETADSIWCKAWSDGGLSKRATSARVEPAPVTRLLLISGWRDLRIEETLIEGWNLHVGKPSRAHSVSGMCVCVYIYTDIHIWHAFAVWCQRQQRVCWYCSVITGYVCSSSLLSPSRVVHKVVMGTSWMSPDYSPHLYFHCWVLVCASLSFSP